MAELINIETSTEGAISSSKEDEDIKKFEPSTSDDNSSSTPVVPESPKPLAFTIDFGERKPVDTNRFKNMLEKYQNRHRRGQSLSKIQSPKELIEAKSKPIQKPPSSANFPRKTDYHSEGYFSSDQEDKSDASFLRQLKMLSLKSNVMNSLKQPNLKSELTLPLQNTTSQRLSESKHNFDINHITSPEMDLKDISSPEFDILTPSDPTPCMVKSMPEFTTATTTAATVKSPRTTKKESQSMFIAFHPINNQVTTAVIQPKNKILTENIILNNLTDISKRNVAKPLEEDTKSDVEDENYDIEDSDSVSEAGTYTLDADNYTEEQKARMSIDREINVAPEIPALQRTQQFVESTLQYCSNHFIDTNEPNNISLGATSFIIETSNSKNLNTTNNDKLIGKNLSPQDSLTQISIEGSNNTINIHSNLVKKNVILNNLDSLRRNKKNTNKILFASSKARNGCGLEQEIDTTGSFTSITTCGVFNRSQQTAPNNNIVQATTLMEMSPERKSPRRDSLTRADIYYENLKQNIDTATANNKKPPMSPTKIPSPVHSLSRPRSRASLDLSDSSVETDSYLKHTQNVITSLQARLQSDHQSTNKYDQRNNKLAQNIIKNQTKHIRHNSFDSKNTSNKLENFHSKVLQPIGIDQTNLCTPTIATRSPTHKLYNSPNNSPIKRSSSFSVKQMSQSYAGHPTDFHAYVNSSPIASPRVLPKDTNLLRMSPNLNDASANTKVHRSSSTASIRKHLNPLQYRRNSANSPEHHQRTATERSSNESINQKRDKTNQILITSESSSDDEFAGTNNMFIRNSKEFNNLTNTRHNRAFSLRRARLDLDSHSTSKCPNTPEMRRKFQPNPNTTPEPVKKVAGGTSVRSASIDSRKPSVEVKSRYMNITKSSPTVQQHGLTPPSSNIVKTTSSNASRVIDVGLNNKSVPSNRQVAAMKSSTCSSVPTTKNTVIARTDSGRFSMRTSRPKPMSATPKSNTKKGNRSNSTLTSREVEFQNWKRRKSYDPMKAAAEGKRKAELNKKMMQNNANIMTQSYTQTTQECDSSPSHSSSVHRSQSFHGTGGLDNYISSDEDLTLSVDDADGITPPVPTPIRGSPDKIVISQSHIKQAWGAKNTRY